MNFVQMDIDQDRPDEVTATELPAMSEQTELLIHRSMDGLEAQWRGLEALDVNSLHHGFDWCRAWISAYRRPVMIVEGRQQGETAFILPLEIVQGRLFTKAQFIGGDHANINTGLMSQDFIARATPAGMARIAAEIRSKLSGADCLLLSNMPRIWRGQALPFSLLPSVENQNHAFALTLRATFVDTLAQLNAKRRRKKYSVSHRRLEAMGGYVHGVADSSAERRDILDLFYKQKGARLAEFGLPNVFACPMTRKFFHALAQQRQDETQFPLRLHYLKMTGGAEEGTVAAIAGLSRKGDHVIVQFCSIQDGPTMEASPGELLFHLMIERYNEEQVALFDFGIGDMAFKRSWCNEETVQVNVTVPLTSLGRLAALKEEAATRLKATIKQNPAVYAFLQKIRARSHVSHPAEAEEQD